MQNRVCEDMGFDLMVAYAKACTHSAALMKMMKEEEEERRRILSSPQAKV